MKLNAKVIYIFILTNIVVYASNNLKSIEENKRWDVKINTSSIEKILLHPEEILINPDAFWKTDEAYKLSLMWHNNNKVSLEDKDYYNKWLIFLEDRKKLSNNERENDSSFQLLEMVKSKVNIFEEKSIPLIDSFLPKNNLKFNTTVYITTKTYAFAFMTNGQIVSDILSYYFEKDPNKIMNSITHECFHIGYGYNRYFRKEAELENSMVYNTMLDALQNEGLATYLGYKAQLFFPVKELQDYTLLNDFSEVKKSIKSVNELFIQTENLLPDSLQKKSWKIGVVDRGYYVAGAFMAKTIDEKLGRKTLIETIKIGPLNFVDTYNSVAEDNLKIFTFNKNFTNNVMQNLKSSVFDEKIIEFDSLANKILLSNNSDKINQNQIVKLGYGMIYLEKYNWAIKVFELGVKLYPNSANSYDCLAEAYLKSGNQQNAIKYYKKALDTDPEFINAKEMLKSLE